MQVELNINGILTLPGKSRGWTDRAVTHAHLDLDMHAEKLENFSGVFTRMLFQRKRARFVARIANKYLDQGCIVYLRGHSNGCDTIRRALSHITAPIEAVQLVAPEVDSDFERNGFNQLLRDKKVQRLLVCWGPNDRALKVARHFHKFLNVLGNAYGVLGLTGPINVAPDVRPQVTSVANVQFNHGDWLAKENLLQTMGLLHEPSSSWEWRKVG
jgi:predicted alpha/beta hydrolase family esterase